MPHNSLVILFLGWSLCVGSGWSQPVLTSVEPAVVRGGGTSPTTLIVRGTGFSPGTIVQWNAQVLGTTFHSPTELEGSVPAAFLSQPGRVAISVLNPVGGAPLSDEFESTGLSPAWAQYRPADATIAVQQGELDVGRPTSCWFQDSEGALVHQSVRGDFSISAVVRVDGGLPGTLPTAPPGYHFGGIAVRAPGTLPGNRNSVHIVGGMANQTSPGVEDKTTLASTSNFVVRLVPSLDLELRIERVGTQVSTSYRQAGAPAWTAFRSHSRPDLPFELQAGAIAYRCGTNQSDLAAHFDRIIFAAAGAPFDLDVLPPLETRVEQATPGAPIILSTHALVPGREAFHVLSTELCPAGPGTGPFGGLCASDPQSLFDQLALPLGAGPFHFAVTAPSMIFGPYALPPGFEFDVLAIELAPLGYALSPVVRFAVQ